MIWAWLGQGGFAVRLETGYRILVDPYLSNECYRFGENLRLWPPPLDPDNVDADLVLWTHEHRDHCDPGFASQFLHSHPRASARAPASCVARLEREFGVAQGRVGSLSPGQRENLAEVVVCPVDAIHPVEAVGYVLRAEAISLYISGDTLYEPRLVSESVRGVDLAMVCVNGRLGNMSATEASRYVVQLSAQFAVPMHYGLFDRNDHWADEFEREIKTLSSKVTPFRAVPGVAYRTVCTGAAVTLTEEGPIQALW